MVDRLAQQRNVTRFRRIFFLVSLFQVDTFRWLARHTTLTKRFQISAYPRSFRQSAIPSQKKKHIR